MSVEWGTVAETAVEPLPPGTFVDDYGTANTEQAVAVLTLDGDGIVVEGDPHVLLTRLGKRLLTGDAGTRDRALSRARVALAAVGDDSDDGLDGTNAVDMIVDLLHFLRSMEDGDDGLVPSAEERLTSAHFTFADEESEWKGVSA